jgi:hypothetical protein
MRVLCAVVEIPMLAMFYAREQLALGGSVAFEFIRYDHARYVGQSLEQLAEKPLRGLLVTVTLHQNVEDVAVLIHCPPEIMPLTLDGEKDLVEMPLVTGPRTAATELIGIRLPEFTTPLANSLIGHDDTTFQQELFDVAEAQAKAKVQPYSVADDLHGKTMVLIASGWGYSAHAATVSYRLDVEQVVNAFQQCSQRAVPES